MKYNVYYSYRGDKYCAGQYARRTDAEDHAAALRADHWAGVYIRAVHPGEIYQGC